MPTPRPILRPVLEEDFGFGVVVPVLDAVLGAVLVVEAVVAVVLEAKLVLGLELEDRVELVSCVEEDVEVLEGEEELEVDVALCVVDADGEDEGADEKDDETGINPLAKLEEPLGLVPVGIATVPQ